MDKLINWIATIIQNNSDQIIQNWKTQRQSESFWYNGEINEEFLKQINEFAQSLRENIPNRIDLIINSYGGQIEPAYQAISLLDRNFKNTEINFIVPRMAKSAATLIATGCDNLLFSQIGEIGPLDVQIFQVGSNSPISGITTHRLIEEELKGEKSNKYMREWIYRKLTPVEVLEQKRFNEVASSYLCDLLPRRMFKGKSAKDIEVSTIIKKLCLEYPNHSYVINKEIAEIELKFKVNYLNNVEENLVQQMNVIWEFETDLKRIINLNKANELSSQVVNYEE